MPATLLKGTPTQVFTSEICEIFKNTYFEEYLGTTASVLSPSSLFIFLYENTFCIVLLVILPYAIVLFSMYIQYVQFIVR